MKLNSEITAIITGAASGLGLAVAEALAERDVRVGILDMNQDEGRQ